MCFTLFPENVLAMIRQVLTVVVVAAAGIHAQINWDGAPFAASSVSKSPNVQTVLSVGGGTSGAQFLYTKNATIPAPLVSVRLVSLSDKSLDLELSDYFDMMTQACSCYWLEAKELLDWAAKSQITLPDDTSYRILFRERKGNHPRVWGSGLFGIASSNVSSLPAPKIKEFAEVKQLEFVGDTTINVNITIPKPSTPVKGAYPGSASSTTIAVYISVMSLICSLML
jgi:hypothetical protein